MVKKSELLERIEKLEHDNYLRNFTARIRKIGFAIEIEYAGFNYVSIKLEQDGVVILDTVEYGYNELSFTDYIDNFIEGYLTRKVLQPKKKK